MAAMSQDPDERPAPCVDAGIDGDVFDPPPPPNAAEEPCAVVLSKGKLVRAGRLRLAVALTLDVLILLASLAVLALTVHMFQNYPYSLGDYPGGEHGQATAPQIVHTGAWVVVIVGAWLLFALLWSSARQATHGKQIVGIKIVNARRAGWGFAVLQLSIFVCKALPWTIPVSIVFSIYFDTYAVRTARAKISEVLAAMRPLQEEIAKQGCQAGNRSPSSAVTDDDAAAMIAAIDVTNTGPDSCTITITLSGKRYNRANPAAPVDSFPAGLAGKKFQLTRGQNGSLWGCSSDIYPRFVPPTCR